MAIDRVITGDSRNEAEENFNVSLRPKQLHECIGQQKVIDKLKIAIEAAKKEKRTVGTYPVLRASRIRQNDISQRGRK